MVGSVIAGKYRLTRELGKGGMGAVFEATHVGTSRRVALKLMRASASDDDDTQSQVARFQREAIAAGRLETQHVVQVYDAGKDEATQQPYLAMELLEGEDVSQLIRRIGPLREDLALAIVTQACAALQKAHDAGVIHRDIKPSNMFLAKNEYGEYTLKVLDFGIAKVRRDDAVNDAGGTITETGTLVGSPHYMSPEQAKGLKTIDHRTDLWSLAVVLHKCLSGRTPFDGYSTIGQVIVAVCSEDPISVQEHAPWVRQELSSVLRQALRRDPNQRHPSAMALLEALRPFLPNGPRITEAMLRPLSDDEKRRIMPRRSDFPTQATPPPGSHTMPAQAPATSSSSWLASATGPAAPSSSGAMPAVASTMAMRAPSSPSFGTHGSFVSNQASSEPSKPRPRRVWPIALVASLVVGAAAIVAVPKIRTMALARSASAAPASTTATTAQPAATTTSTSTSTSTSTTTMTKASVAVTPQTASVEIDGVAAAVQSGHVDVEGAPGSVHKVKVAEGGRETVIDVVLTDKGPLPAKVALEPAKTAAPTTPAKPAVAAPVTPVKPAAAPAKPPSTGAPAPAKTAGGFDRSFE